MQLALTGFWNEDGPVKLKKLVIDITMGKPEDSDSNED